MTVADDETLRHLIDHVCRHPCDDASWAYLHDHLTEGGFVSPGLQGAQYRLWKRSCGRRDWIDRLKWLRRFLLARRWATVEEDERKRLEWRQLAASVAKDTTASLLDRARKQGERLARMLEARILERPPSPETQGTDP